VVLTDSPRFNPDSEFLLFTNPRSTITVAINITTSVTKILTFTGVGYSLLLKPIYFTIVESTTMTDIANIITNNALVLVIFKLN
jgi:hypothetical protein